MTKTEFVLNWLDEHGIEYQVHYHPPLPTIEEALAYWKNIDSTHCKNLFFEIIRATVIIWQVLSATRIWIFTGWSIL